MAKPNPYAKKQIVVHLEDRGWRSICDVRVDDGCTVGQLFKYEYPNQTFSEWGVRLNGASCTVDAILSTTDTVSVEFDMKARHLKADRR